MLHFEEWTAALKIQLPKGREAMSLGELFPI
jgi:hypothetical protein